MRRIYWVISLLILISIVAKFGDFVPFLGGKLGEVRKDIYEVLKDMSLLIATGGVAYISNVYQRRSAFIESLKAEWADILKSKSAVLTFLHKDAPTHDDYVSAYMSLSETIDNMRVVYKNVGETDDLIGIYPYAPLHDMRRVLQTLDPKNGASSEATPSIATPFVATPEYRKLARDTVLRSFYALRDEYLAELDLEEPDTPLLLSGARRLSKPGALGAARGLQNQQIAEHKAHARPDDPSDALLHDLNEQEEKKRR
jgi:hypothetical protein